MANAKNNPASFLPLAQFQPHSALTRIHRFSIPANGAKVQGPNLPVPPGASITFRPIASNGAQNASAIFFSDSPDTVTVSGAYNVVPTGSAVSIPFSVSNLHSLWFSGQQNDGLIITIQIPAVG